MVFHDFVTHIKFSYWYLKMLLLILIFHFYTVYNLNFFESGYTSHFDTQWVLPTLRIIKQCVKKLNVDFKLNFTFSNYSSPLTFKH